MFLLRSAFWLTIAFLVIHPHGVDPTATVRGISSQAMASGERFIVQQIVSSSCLPLECSVPPKPATTLAASTTLPSAASPAQGTTVTKPAPFPRPRPDWMG